MNWGLLTPIHSPLHLPFLLLSSCFAQHTEEGGSWWMKPLVPLYHLPSFLEGDLGEKSPKSH